MMRELVPVIARIKSPDVLKTAFEVALVLGKVSYGDPKFRCVLRLRKGGTCAAFITNRRSAMNPDGWSCVDIDERNVFFAIGVKDTRSGEGNDLDAISRIVEVLEPRLPLWQPDASISTLTAH